MITLSELYQIAQREKVDVDCFDLKKREAISMMDTDGCCFIAINPYKLKSDQEERIILAHELGHCITGSFYNVNATVDCRKRHENQADKWLIQNLIPKEDLLEAMSAGYIEPWELADYFEVPEDYIRKAVCFYKYGNLSSETYF